MTVIAWLLSFLMVEAGLVLISAQFMSDLSSWYPSPQEVERQRLVEKQTLLLAVAENIIANNPRNLISFRPIEDYEEPDGVGAPTELPRAS